MYNQWLKIGYFPTKWKEAQGIMLPKPKNDNKIPANYRPISLLSCIGKLFEKITAHRMRSKLDEKIALISGELAIEIKDVLWNTFSD